MLKIALLFAAAAFAASFLALGLLAAPPSSAPPPQVERMIAPAPAPSATSDGAGERSIPADAGGQYALDVLIGGERVHMLVDTGATLVTISAEVAARLGLAASGGRKWRVHTANGDAVATETTLPSVDLGTIYMRDVKALIAGRDAGPVNLLGASFLKRLSSVEQRNGVLVLRQ
jgi:aspartyl protease family protein